MVDMVDSVLQCHGCDSTLCPFHTTQRCLRRSVCTECDEGSSSSSEEEREEDEGSEQPEFYIDPWLAEYNDQEDVVIMPSPSKRPRPAPPALISTALRACLETDAAECSICLDTFLTDNGPHVLPCSTKHAFHKTCIVRWLEREHATCPVCNATV